MTSQPETQQTDSSRSFVRKLVDVRQVFRDAMVRYISDGRIADKEKLEQAKLKISASLVNFVVNGGVIFFATEEKGGPPIQDQLDEGHELTEDELFHLLRETIFRMLNELNKPDVNLLKVSLAKPFREAMQSIFTEQAADDPGKFPVKIFQDFHDGRGYYIGINMRNTRSVGDDIDRIEADPELKNEIIAGTRLCRHSDGNLMKMFGQAPEQPGEKTG